MENTPLGLTGVTVSRVGFGGATIGGYDYGPTDDAESVAAVRAALDRGVNVFDTADVYGFGHAEVVLAAALGSRRDDVIIATKFGVAWDDRGRVLRDSSPRRVREAIEGSLRRLRLNCIPLYQLHWWDGFTPIAETLYALEQCRREGLIRYVGLCNLPEDLLREALQAMRVDAVQYRFSLLERQMASMIALGVESHQTVLVYSALAHGLLTGKYESHSRFQGTDLRTRSPLFCGEKYQRALQSVGRVRAIAERIGRTPAQVAMRWVLQSVPGSVVLAGIRSRSQAEENAKTLGWSLDAADIETLRKVDLSSADDRNPATYETMPPAKVL